MKFVLKQVPGTLAVWMWVVALEQPIPVSEFIAFPRTVFSLQQSIIFKGKQWLSFNVFDHSVQQAHPSHNNRLDEVWEEVAEGRIVGAGPRSLGCFPHEHLQDGDTPALGPLGLDFLRREVSETPLAACPSLTQNTA